MTVLNIRLTSKEDLCEKLINTMTRTQGVERAEEVGEMMPHMDDPDSSSLGLRGDMGPGYHTIIVETDSDAVARQVRLIASEMASGAGAALEFVDDF